ncbi:unnamed protein product, partial [marine sediment metagenome]
PKSGEVFNSCIFHAPIEKKLGKEDELLEKFNEYYIRLIEESKKDKKIVLNCKGFIFPEVEDGYEFFSDKTISFPVDFSDAVFYGEVFFKNVKFLSLVSFENALFNGLHL